MTEFDLTTLGAAPTVLGLSMAGAVQEAIIQQQLFALKFAMMGLLLERKDAMTGRPTPGGVKMIVSEREKGGNVKEEMRIRLLYAVLSVEIRLLLERNHVMTIRLMTDRVVERIAKHP